MRVSTTVQVDIDLDAWRANYGEGTPSQIRADVKQLVDEGARQHLKTLGLLKEESSLTDFDLALNSYADLRLRH